MASCVKENVSLNGNGGEEVKVTFTTELPISVEVSRDIGDGTAANYVFYAVYEGEELVLSSKQRTTSERYARIELNLFKNVQYDVVFWAQNENAPYVFDAQEKKVTYNTDATMTANSEALDAFYGKKSVKIDGPFTTSVKLDRPLAQINFGTTQEDFDAAKILFGSVINESSLVVEGAKAGFDIFNGVALEGIAKLELAKGALVDETITVNNKDFVRLATTYVFADAEGDVVDGLTLSVYSAEGNKSYSMNEIPSVNVKANHRTNIVGRLLTGNTNFDVNIDEGIVDGKFNIDAVVSNAADFEAAVVDANVTYIKFDSDIDLTNGAISTLSTRAEAVNTLITIPADRKNLTIDLGGKSLSWTNKVADVNGDGSLTAKDNVALFDVRGNLTVKNGTVKLTHAAENFGWNGCSQVFCVATNGVLNVENATIENCGGTDMAYAFDLVGAGSEGITLNVVNSTLKSTYIPVRIFNNGAGMNNVTIKKSTLEGVSRCIWVHVYSSKDNGGKGVKDATLNLDFFNTLDNVDGKNNNFVNANPARIIEFGFDDEVNFNEYGDIYVAEGVGKDAEGNYLVYNAAGLNWLAAEVNKYSNYEYPFKDETIKLVNDVDLDGVEWTPIGDYRFSANRFCGTFDGQGHTISNFKITKKTDKNDSNKSSYGFFGNVEGTVKNLTVANATVNSYAYTGALVGRLNNSGLIENCHVVDCAVSNTYWQGGILIGQINGGTVSGCTVSNSSITSKSAIGALAGPTTAEANVLVENCTVKNCQVNQQGSFGGSYDNYFGSLFGYTEATGDKVININNCKVENTTVKGETNAPISGDFDGNICVDGALAISNAEALAAALKKGGEYFLVKDIAVTEATYQNVNVTINGNGHTISQVEGSTNTYALFDINGGKVALKNIVFDGVKGGAVVRTVGTEFEADNVTVKNCEHTHEQGLFRLYGKNTIKNSTFVNNNCTMGISFNFDANGDAVEPQIVKDCVFENNVCNTTAVVYYAEGGSATIDGNKFLNNTLTVSNGATLYMGFKKNCTITNNVFDGNTVTATSKRSSGGLMIGNAAEVKGNCFVNNTVTVNGQTGYGNDVCASPYYAAIDLSGNYWGGGAPVEGDDYYKEYNNYEVIINDYLTTWSK